MKTIRLLILPVLWPTAATLAQTRVSIGPVASLNESGVYFQKTENDHIIYRAGFEAGVQSVVQFGHLSVQPSLRFSQKGYHYHYGYHLNNTDTDYRYNYLTLPLNLAYSLRTNGQGLQLLAGPYAALLLGGTFNTVYGANVLGPASKVDGQIKPGSEQPFFSSDLYQRSVDLGVQTGLGYRYGPLLAQATFSFGLRRVDLYSSGSGTYHRVAQASLGYLFNSRRD